MKSLPRVVVIVGLMLTLALSMPAQEKKKAGVLEGAELKQAVPANYFFDGQVASVQIRNCAAVRLQSGQLILAGLVDTSGYSTSVAAKYQGFFITEEKITIENKTLAPGQYGFGFAEGKFRVMDVAANDVLLVDHHQDDNLKRPVPLKIVEENGNYRLYAGKKYVTISAQ